MQNRFWWGLALLVLTFTNAKAQPLPPQTVSKVGTPAPNAVTIQTSPGAPLATTATFSGSVTASNPSVGVVGATTPTSTTLIGGDTASGKSLVPYVMTSTPSGAEPGLVVRMPAGASGLTNAELRASPVPVQATVTSTTITGSVAVTGPLTNTEARASPLPVQATVTSTTITGSVAVTGPLTNAELRASPVPVQATVTSTTITGSVAVTGPLTNAELRAAPVSTSSTQNGAWTVGATQSGGWNVGQSGAPWSVTSTSSQLPSALVGGRLPVDGSAVIQPVSGGVTMTSTTITGTVASTQSGGWNVGQSGAPWSVTSTSSQLPPALIAGRLPVDAGNVTMTSTTITGNVAATLTGQSVTSTGVAQGSTTSGQTGFLVQGAVSSTPPTYTTGQTSPLALTLAGGLRTTGNDLSEFLTAAALTTSTTLFQMVALNGTLKTYVLNWKCSASGAATTTTDQQCLLKYGTGTDCATGTTLADGCFNPATGGCNGGQIVVPAGKAVCAIHAAAGTKIWSLTYKQAP